MGYVKLILGIILAIFIAVFAGNNDQAVELNLYPLPYQFSASLFLISFICIIFGVILGGTALSIKTFYWKRVAGSAKQRADKLEARLNQNKTNELSVK